MTVLVTGAAGFVGSHLCEHLLAREEEVIGVDALTSFYPRAEKLRNLEVALSHPSFTFVEADLTDAPLAPLLERAEVVYHLAGQPGVRPSWGRQFEDYVRHNVLATQRLLEHLKDGHVRKFVFASSSSVYGNAESYPTAETVRPQPVSPYGVTKLAAENLCELYRFNFGIPTASLRLFTVYGPRQRPDMAFSRLLRAAVAGKVFELYGDGRQTRDFTYVADVVRAMESAAASDWCGVANIGGGSRTSMLEVIECVAELYRTPKLAFRPAQAGDVRHTAADVEVAATSFGFRPRTGLRDGLRAMLNREQDRAERTEVAEGAGKTAR